MELSAKRRLGADRYEGRTGSPAMVRAVDGTQAAAFAAAALTLLQDAPVDVTNYYSADIHGFGVFTEYGEPKKVFYGLKAFKMLADTRSRLPIRGQLPVGVAVASGIDAAHRQMTILASNFGSREESLRIRVRGIPWQGPTACQSLLVDAEHDLATISSRAIAAGDATIIEQMSRPASVCVIRLQGAEK